MDRSIVIDAPPAVRAVIARVILGAQSSEPALGSIRLKSHQVSSIARLESALREFGGALLCDAVGMGKTFVALAIARRFSQSLIVAPAGLREMWRDALARAQVDARFITFERLSRGEPPRLTPDLLIIDESHHARNPATRRYARIARLARNARVMLLTATPIHNRRADLVALLSLFLGSRANSLTERELSRCLVRREPTDTAEIIGIPHVLPVVACDVPDDPDLVARLMSLPPPLPPRGGDSGGALINRGLIHQWASSEAALRDAVRRRVARATALIASLGAGRYPTATELESWTFADGALQLGFAELLASPTLDADALLRSVLTHSDALERFLQSYVDQSAVDDARARILVDILRENRDAKIVAFAQYASTVSALFRRLTSCGRVAMLTATGARVAGGKLSREDAIARFAPLANGALPPSRAETIDLLLATDLLSEGVNLQDAEVVVHLDVPWTAARMDQRVGRVARMGSQHSQVRVYQFRPPASAEAVLRGEALVAAKWDIARSASSIPSRAEHLRAILGQWVDAGANRKFPETGIRVAAVTASQTGFMAAGYLGSAPILLTCLANSLSTELNAQIAACLVAEGSDATANPSDFQAALRAIQDWVEQYEASEAAGATIAAPACRKPLLQRIDATLQRAPPHLRASRAGIVASARRIASAPHGAAVEADLVGLTDSTLSDDEWLSALTAVAPRKERTPLLPRDFQLIALLLFKP